MSTPKAKAKIKAKATLTPPGSDPFRPGVAVEISSNDDGFRGSWFSGVVLSRARPSRSPSNPNKKQKFQKATAAGSPTSFWVQYDNLFKDEAGTTPLKELVHQFQLRPVPPREPESEAKYNLNDEVDAYYNDGWWEGVVTEDLGNGRYELYFRASKESLQFGTKDLRLHREWINDSWVPALDEKQNLPDSRKVSVAKGTGTKFKKGTLVEVSSDEDGFQGAWFLAKTVKELAKGKYLVQYKNLWNDDDADFLKEEIDTLHIRPCPPETKVINGFKILDEVDAMYNDGWWVGVIYEVLEDSRYKVYFRDTEEELEFHHSELRLHQEWIAGKWVVASPGMTQAMLD